MMGINTPQPPAQGPGMMLPFPVVFMPNNETTAAPVQFCGQTMAPTMAQTMAPTMAQTMAPQIAFTVSQPALYSGLTTSHLIQSMPSVIDPQTQAPQVSQVQMVFASLPNRMPLSAAPVSVPMSAVSAPFQVPVPVSIPFQVPVPTATASPPATPTGTKTVSPKSGSPSTSKVLLLVGLPLHIDVTLLEREVEDTFGRRVVRSLPVWNKAALLVELESPATLSSRRVPLSINGVHAVPSQKPFVRSIDPTVMLNVRFFVMCPEQDFVATPAESAAYNETEQGWRRARGLPSGVDFEFGALLEQESGEMWEHLVTPAGARQHTEQPTPFRRMYTQVFFEYANKAVSTKVAAKIDGMILNYKNLRLVIRAEFARPSSVETTLHKRNPRLAATPERANDAMPKLV
eukprot:Hpha_TRINITY_DN15999_c0_g1::TRINITY_DN15999_c0_g1_i2::g.71229::m.71229